MNMVEITAKMQTGVGDEQRTVGLQGRQALINLAILSLGKERKQILPSILKDI